MLTLGPEVRPSCSPWFCLCREVLAHLKKLEATIKGCQRLGKDPLTSLELNFRFVGSPGVGLV